MATDLITSTRTALEAAEAARNDALDAGVTGAALDTLRTAVDTADEAYWNALDGFGPATVSPRYRAAQELAAEFGDDISEWLV